MTEETGIMENNNEKSLEDRFAELQEIIKKLEEPGVKLEDAFALYTDGCRILKQCNESIDKVEKQLIVLEEGETDV